MISNISGTLKRNVLSKFFQNLKDALKNLRCFVTTWNIIKNFLFVPIIIVILTLELSFSMEDNTQGEEQATATWGGKKGKDFPSAPQILSRTISRSTSKSEVTSHPFSSATEEDAAFEFLKDVKSVDLSGNGLSSKSSPLLLKLAQQNPNLCEIKLDDNDIPSEIKDQIGLQLEKNKKKKDIEQRSTISKSVSWLEDIISPRDYIVPKDDRPIYYGLSVDGGGMKGLMPAIFFARMQEVIDQRYGKGRKTFKDIFRGFAGSSIGGVLALGTVKQTPLPPEELIGLFTEKGKTIFKPSSYDQKGVFRSRYQSKALEEFFSEYFGNEELKNIKNNRLIITGVRTDTPEGLTPYLFDSQRAYTDVSSNFLLKDVARATAAAPTFFPRALIRDRSPQRNLYEFWDGGLWKNDPAELLLNALVHQYPGSRIKILSFGTGQSKPAYETIQSDGVIGSISPLLFGQMDLSANVSPIMKQRIGEDYQRLQPLLLESNGALLDVEMDNTSPKVLKRYQQLANACWEEKQMDAFVNRMLAEVDSTARKAQAESTF